MKKFFYNYKEMFEWLIYKIEVNKRNKRKTYIYAHNAEYDWYAIAKDSFLDEKIKYILFHPFLTIYNESGYFLDTMAFYRTSLDKVGEMLGRRKLEMPKQIKEIRELEEYVERDTRIVMDAILHLKNTLGTLGYRPRKLLTAGQLAMTSFLTYNRRRYIEKYFTRYNEELRRREVIKTKYPLLIRQAYRGGDNQAYQIGKYNNVSLIDINGLYADIMRKMSFPDLASENYIVEPTLGMFYRYLENNMGVAQIEVEIPNIKIGVLPIRYADYQVFPTVGMLKGTWTFIEIKEAIKSGYIIKSVDWCIRYDELIVDKKPFNPLRDFIEHIYDLEKNSKTKLEKMPIKMLRNNLSGKFAQYKKNKEYKLVRREDVMKYIEAGWRTTARMNEYYIVLNEEGVYEPSYTNPIISTRITALGRLRLLKEKRKVPYDALYYNDTDSLIIDSKYLDRYKVSKELGDFKIEEHNTTCKILGEKRYYIGDKVKISGVHSRNRSIDNIEKERNININRIYGLGNAFLTGQFSEVGSFKRYEIEMKPHAKNMIPLPNYINEVKQ